jgi:dihydroflavonol-4-reductase
MKVPHAVAMGFAIFDQFFTGTIMGKEPRATIDAVKMGRKKMFASSGKAARELGYKVLPVEDALRRAIDWFQERGYAETAAQVATVNA